MPFKQDWTQKVSGIPQAHLEQLPPVNEAVEMRVPDGEEFDIMDPEVQPDAEGNYPAGTKVVATYIFQAPKEGLWKLKRTRAKRVKQAGSQPAAAKK